MSFRKRPPISYGGAPSFRDVLENEDHKRTLVTMNVREFALKNPCITEEYSLTEELRAGVPLKELNVKNLIGSNDPADNTVDESAYLNMVQEAVEESKTKK